MKKLFIFLIVMMMIFSMVSCSSDDNEKETLDKTEDNQESNNDGQVNSTEDTTETEENVPLPEGYPDDLVPIIEGSKIESSNKQIQDGTEEMFVRVLSNKSRDEAFDFYKEALSERTDINESDFAEILTIECILENKDITIDVLEDNEYEGYLSLIRITIIGESSSDEANNEAVEDVDLNSANSDLINEDLIPEEYPFDLAPIYGGSTIYDAGIIEMENEMFYITATSNDNNEKVINFYKSVFTDIENKQEADISSGMYQIGGEIDGRHILVTIGNDKENTGYESSISITVDK